MPYLYKISVAQPGTALRLAFAVCFMLVQKSTGLAVPILFKTAVDHLTAAAVFSSQADAAGVYRRARRGRDGHRHLRRVQGHQRRGDGAPVGGVHAGGAGGGPQGRAAGV